MANYKIVTLKDPVTGEYLIPRVPRSLAYDVLDDGSIQAPIDMDAGTLGGHPASDFLLKSEYTPTDLSAYMKTADANNTFAAKSHNHDGVYSPVSHTHSIAQVTGLQIELDSLKTSVSEGKSLIAVAVTDKGVQTAADATFQQMATNIGNIPLGSDVITGYFDVTSASQTHTVPELNGRINMMMYDLPLDRDYDAGFIVFTCIDGNGDTYNFGTKYGTVTIQNNIITLSNMSFNIYRRFYYVAW